MTNSIIYEDNCVRKILRTAWPKYHYDLFKIFAHDKKYLPKVYSYVCDIEYTMEKLDILCTVQEGLIDPKKYKLNRDIILSIPAMYNQIFVDCLNFTRLHVEDKLFFMHRDLHLSNVVITKDHKIMLIDVDAFEKTYKMVPWKYLNNYMTILWMSNEALLHV